MIFYYDLPYMAVRKIHLEQTDSDKLSRFKRIAEKSKCFLSSEGA